MFFRILPRLTPGYIRYLQTQAAQTVFQPRDSLVMPRTALFLGLMGIGLSGYSTRQLTLNYKPATTLDTTLPSETVNTTGSPPFCTALSTEECR
uniref:Uncharacterized protein n=1 Tax=Neogobius melanostomus TaxID=47308 RepID=A0A8C6SU62_9GOBI